MKMLNISYCTAR